MLAHPSTFTRARLSIVANPLTKDSKFQAFSFSQEEDRQIIVPGADRLNIFLIIMGMS